MPAMVETIARRKLLRWHEEGPPEERGQVRIAEACGVTQSAVSQWMRGETRPTEGLKRDLLERLTGIAAPLWLTGVERKERRKLVEARR